MSITTTERESFFEDEAVRKSAEKYALNTYSLRLLAGETLPAHHERVVADLASAIVEMGQETENRTNLVFIPLVRLEELARRSRTLRNEARIDQMENRATDRLLLELTNLPPSFDFGELKISGGESREKTILQKIRSFWPEICHQTSKVGLWISPPTEARGIKGNHEARFCFYLKVLINHKPEIIIVSVCGKQSAEQCLKLASQLVRRFGNNLTAIPESEEQLRETPLLLRLPKGKAWETLAKIFQEESVFLNILNGSCLENKLEAFVLAEKIYWQVCPVLIRARTQGDFFWAGVRIEEAMRATGRVLSLSSCGESYLGALSARYHPLLSLVGGESKKFVQRCGNCGALIMDYIGKGYRCPHCSGVYEGC